MNIKKATIVGVLQDWDVDDVRVGIERVRYDVPLFLLDAFYDEEIKGMVDNVFFGGDDDAPLGLLLGDMISGGFIAPKSSWEIEDPCELRLEIEEEQYIEFKQQVGKGTIDDARDLPCPNCGEELDYFGVPEENYMKDGTFVRSEVLVCRCGIEIEVEQVYAPTKCSVKEINDRWFTKKEEA